MDTPEPIEVQAAFFHRVLDKFLEAKTNVQEVDLYYGLCGTTIRLCFAGEELIRHITPALSHLQISRVESPDFTINLWDSRSTNTRMVPAPWKADRYTYRGDIWGYNSNRIKTAFHWFEFSLNMFDSESNTGIFWVEHAGSFPYWAHASPLRTLLHWWMQKNSCQLVHGAAIGTEKGAVLLSGKGGIGKTTTALSCLTAGLDYLGDDYVVLRLQPEPSVFSLYNTAKLNADDVAKFPEYSGLISNPENLSDEKAVVFLYPEYRRRLAPSMPLRAILVPGVTELTESRITETSPENTLRAVSFTTMTQLPGAGIETFELLNQLSSKLPCYSFELGRDLKNIPNKIVGFLDDLPAVSQTKEQFSLSVKTYPLVSVIIPVYNGERFIRDAVDSILSQDYSALEIIAVNDGSTDKTRDVISDLSGDLSVEIRYFEQDNSGPAAARNRGIKEASGEYIAFLDVDDLWPEGNLRMLVEELSENRELDVVQGYAQLSHYNPETGSYDYSGNPEESFANSIAAAIYRKSVFTKVGLFDPTLMYGEDADWFQRAKELKVNIKKVHAITLIVRRHGKNMTYGKDMLELNMLRVFKKTLDRMRLRKLEESDSA